VSEFLRLTRLLQTTSVLFVSLYYPIGTLSDFYEVQCLLAIEGNSAHQLRWGMLTRDWLMPSLLAASAYQLRDVCTMDVVTSVVKG